MIKRDLLVVGRGFEDLAKRSDGVPTVSIAVRETITKIERMEARSKCVDEKNSRQRACGSLEFRVAMIEHYETNRSGNSCLPSLVSVD